MLCGGIDTTCRVSSPNGEKGGCISHPGCLDFLGIFCPGTHPLKSHRKFHFTAILELRRRRASIDSGYEFVLSMTGSSKRSSLLRTVIAPAQAVSHASWLYPFKV